MGFRTQKISLLPCILLLLLLAHLAKSQPNLESYFCNYNRLGNNNYTSESTYRRNLDALPSSFTSGSLFYNFTIGDSNTDRVNVIALCRGDVAGDTCRGCLRDANTKLTELCPNEKETIGWYELCMLRYSDRVIFHTVNTLPNRYAYAPTLVPDASVDEFRQAVLSLLNRLTPVASGGNSVRKYATGESNSGRNSNIPIFGLAQCTPDLSALQCSECLNSTTSVLPGSFDWRMGGRVDTPSCNFRFEVHSFYADANNSAPPTGNSTPQPPSDEDDNTTRNVIIIVISIIIFVIFLAVCIWIIVRKRKQKMSHSLNQSDVVKETSSVESLQYDFDTIRAATDEFSDTNKLGEGGFGVVYKGRLPNGQDIAVKRLSMDSRQGEVEFKTEVLLMANLQHKSLVRLIGFCLKGVEKLLIYEYLPNASLDQFIFDSEKRAYLDGDRRCKIIVGIARGLLYLHEDSRVRIIHRDLKASNVLLDAEMNPKISDFGMARIFDLELDGTQTHINTRKIVGTYGYMAPEYAMLGHFSVKSDVYSFGVLVLEILSGQRTTGLRNEDSEEFLLSHAWKSWLEGTHSQFLDPMMKESSLSTSDIMRCLHIGLLCVQQRPADRPTMASVVLMLSSFSLALPTPSEPTFFSIDPHGLEVGDHSEANESTKSKSRSNDLSNNEVSITVLSDR